MLTIEYAKKEDKEFYFSLDKHLNESEFDFISKINRSYIIKNDDKPIGVMRYNMFWDMIPFLTLIFLKEECRKMGFGRISMEYWENEMRSLGHELVMTSTMSNEEAQHFYRKLDYIDAGCLMLENEPLEIILTKKL